MSLVELEHLPPERLKEALHMGETLRRCKDDPVELARFVSCVDPDTGDEFTFGKEGWDFQTDIMRWWQENRKTVILKSRQLGITWLAGVLALHYLIFKPGTRVLVVSINEKEATKVVRRVWQMYQSLPVFIRQRVKVEKPARGKPSDTIELEHPDGKVSAILALASTPNAGHGEVAGLVILDELGRQEYAESTWGAVLPTASRHGTIIAISTGNGYSTIIDGEPGGNFFHFLYDNHEELGVEKWFLDVFTHPERDEAWYEREAMALPPARRGEQYPRNEREAFILTGRPYFDPEALLFYEENRLAQTVHRGHWVQEGHRAVFQQHAKGCVHVYELPVKGHSYAIGADCATGQGSDYSSATVLDLATMAPVCEIYGKMDAPTFAHELHFTGRFYSASSDPVDSAVIAVEDQGGYGSTVIIFLRDGKSGRPPYPKQYRHRAWDSTRLSQFTKYGYPMTQKSRDFSLQGLSRSLSDHDFPYLSSHILKELLTFVHKDTNPSPRAQDGCNDDRVFSLAIARAMFHEFAAPIQHRTGRETAEAEADIEEGEGDENEQGLASRPWHREELEVA